MRATALICVAAGLVLVGAALALTAYMESICRDLYGRSIQQIPYEQWPPSAVVYLAVGVLGLATVLAGLVCAGVVLARRLRR